jgi:UDP-N-acetylglucosamine--N-acetylmuramyl-(pentapeptide) pyrophosphoryl-undecaprenol N-acetylglucosamine transferase
MRVLIAGGGTGGHLYPALAIAKEIKKNNPQADIHFVGTRLGLETQIVPREGFSLHFVSVGRLNQVSLKEKIKTVIKLPLAFFQALFLILKLRPQAILGVGGYASGPALFVGALFGYKTIIWEPNAFPGLANRILSKWVDVACVVFETAAQHLKAKKILRVAMPVRQEIESMKERVPRSANFRILVFGGSQGSRAINDAVIDLLRQGGAWLKTTEFVHQTGTNEFNRVSNEYAKLAVSSERVATHEFLHDMPERYRWADLVISRSGTGTLSELSAAGKASILIPLPTAADDHQRKNAEVMVQAGAAKMILQKDLSTEKLRQMILDCQNNPIELSQLEQNAKKFHEPRAAAKMAQIIESLK